MSGELAIKGNVILSGCIYAMKWIFINEDFILNETVDINQPIFIVGRNYNEKKKIALNSGCKIIKNNKGERVIYLR